MKNKYLFILVAALLISNGGYSQSNFGFSGGVPLKENYAPLFGKDIIINDQPTQTQQRVALCCAFNGWLYSAITYKDPVYTTCAVVTVLRSTDNGITWVDIFDDWFPPGSGDAVFTSVNITAIGNSLPNLKFLLGLVASTTTSHYSTGFVDLHNGETGNFEGHLFRESMCYDLCMATDGMYPALNSSPQSVGILYSKHSFTGGDSIVFLPSNDGGLSFNLHQPVAVTGGHYHKVGLSYGRSTSWASGRYFAIWEEKSDFGDIPGNIFTSHSEPNFDSPFTVPINLDGLDPADYNLCTNPSIACQNNDVDNDSSNLTEVVLFDRYDATYQQYDLEGYYNLQAANHNYFNKMTLTNPAHKCLQPSINFNPFDSTFMVTYYDSTTQRLPYLTNNFNLKNPNTWQFISNGYNDSTTLSAPYPKVALNLEQKKVACVWIRDGSDGKGIAMFDSPYSTWTGVTENNLPADALQLGLYPNPCNSWVTIWFDLQKNANVSIKAYTSLGQIAAVFTDQNYKAGKHELKCNLNNLLPGSYILKLQTDDGTKSTKLIVVR